MMVVVGWVVVWVVVWVCEGWPERVVVVCDCEGCVVCERYGCDW
jgi:hypothetical protein